MVSNEKFSLDGYLDRIKFDGKTDISEETLYDLHVCHTLNVPFENLNSYYKKPILLDRESLYKKIVTDRRGGYCFEMNGLFSFVLKDLGFKVTGLLGRVMEEDNKFTAKLHQVLLVEINGRKWLADVGFGGDGITSPVLMQEDIDQPQFANTYRLQKDPQFGFLLQKKDADGYKTMYAFNLDVCYPEDFEVSNHYTATSPNSMFTQKKFCTMPTKEGRTTLTQKNFKIIANGQVSEKKVESDAEFNQLIRQYFAFDPDLIS